LRVKSPAAHASSFSTLDRKKNQLGTLSQGISNNHKLLWRDSYKGVDPALTPDESILPKIIIILLGFQSGS